MRSRTHVHEVPDRSLARPQCPAWLRWHERKVFPHKNKLFLYKRGLSSRRFPQNDADHRTRGSYICSLAIPNFLAV